MKDTHPHVRSPLHLLFLWEFRQKGLPRWILLSLILHGLLFVVIDFEYPVPEESPTSKARIWMPPEGSPEADRIYAWAEARDPTLLSPVRLSPRDVPLPNPPLYQPSYDRDALPLEPYPIQKTSLHPSTRFAGIDLWNVSSPVHREYQSVDTTQVRAEGGLKNRKILSMPALQIQIDSRDHRGSTRFRVAVSPEGIPLFTLRLDDSGNTMLDTEAEEHLKKIHFEQSETTEWGDIAYFWGNDIYKK